ncbi:MAG: oligosaccharide flippase family protein [Chloroflexi bacterium]|nr:oligosaccharide flippase family protein [Chloroflexota bacterium]
MLRDSLVTFATRVALFGTSTLTAVLTARLLGPEGRGVYALLTQTALLLALVANLGLSPATVYLAGQRRFSVGVLAWNALGAGLLLGLATAPLTWVLYTLAPQLFRGVPLALLALVVLSVPLALTTQMLSSLLLGRQRLLAYNALAGVQGLFGAAALVGALVVEPSVRAATLALVASAAFALLSTAGYVAWAEAAARRPAWTARVLPAALGYGLRGQVANVVQYLNYRMGFFLLNAFAGSAAVGLLSIAVVLAEALWYATNAVATVLFPRVAARGQEPEAVALAAQAARLGFALTALLALGLAVVAPLAVPLLFGAAFAGAVVPLLLLLPGTVAFALTNVLASALAGWGRPGLNAWASTLCFAVTAGLALLAIPPWGTAGAALAMSAGYLAGTAATLALFARQAGLPLRALLLPTATDMMLVGTALRGALRRRR